jgi:serine/threonine protein kinase
VEGTPFGRYRLIELLGRGGMGEVWRARDTSTNNRTVAIKLLPPQMAAEDIFVERFRREADAAAQLNNPHVIPIHTYGEIDGRLYVDMRLIEGRDLQAALIGGPMEPWRAVRIIDQVAKALHAAHEIGLVHRDVKPSNILLGEDDFAYLIDFGIARALDDTRLTNTGAMIGTLLYMAPERFGDSLAEDARADIYALACVLYECLTGTPPFPGSVESILAAHLHAPPPKPSTARPDVPEQFDTVIATGMAKDPDRRYTTTVELAIAARHAVTSPTRGEVLPRTQPGSGFAPEASQPIPPAGQHIMPLGAVAGQPPSEFPPGPPRRPRRWFLSGVAIAAAVIVAIVGTMAWIGITNDGKRNLDRRLDEAAGLAIPVVTQGLDEFPRLPDGQDVITTARRGALVRSSSMTVLPALQPGYADTDVVGVRYRVRTVEVPGPEPLTLAVGTTYDATIAETNNLHRWVLLSCGLAIGAVAVFAWWRSRRSYRVKLLSAPAS